ncbi:MAG: hypothetical protein GY862_05485 [Gammaproteobacteria bacterium]|nr:hypothetical protein [Gammaproteobacteria bacterium]
MSQKLLDRAQEVLRHCNIRTEEAWLDEAGWGAFAPAAERTVIQNPAMVRARWRPQDVP